MEQLWLKELLSLFVIAIASNNSQQSELLTAFQRKACKKVNGTFMSFLTRRRGSLPRTLFLAATKRRLVGATSACLKFSTTVCASGNVVIVPVLEDNYSYLVINEDAKSCLAIDVGEAEPVLREAKRLGLTLDAVLSTHKHWDHIGGNLDVKSRIEGCKIYGPVDGDDPLPGLTDIVRGGDCIAIGPHKILVLDTPCHTAGHVSFYFEKENLLFPGDTLFVGGAGRFFEGTGDDMVKSLETIVNAVPLDSKIFVGHEYTESNLAFALTMEPRNRALLKKIDDVQQQRANGAPTVPTTLQDELLYNPFLRLEEDTIRTKLGLSLDAPKDAVMSRLRQAKDTF